MNSAVRFLLYLVCFALLAATAPADGTADEFYPGERDALIELRESLGATINLHSNWTGPPCYNNRSRWIGVTCSNSHVVGVELDGVQLTGSLRPTALQNVTLLTNISMRDNALRGALPTLQGLVHLRIVAFSGNRFSGAIPIEFVGLPDLLRLELQDNLLNGTIPPFDQQSLREFNVSYNFLEGKIPQTSVLLRFPNSSYDHNLELCGKPLDTPCPKAPPPPQAPAAPPSEPAGGPPAPYPSASGNKVLVLWRLVLITVAAVMIPSIVILCFLCYYKKSHKKEGKEGYNPEGVSSELEDKKYKGLGCRGDSERIVQLEFFNRESTSFDLDDLLRSSAEVMGRGKLGTTYKAILESGPIVVVKRLKDLSGLSKKEFVQQMQLLGRMRHENLVEIISFHYSEDEKLVIYEHVPGENLFNLLHANRGEGRVPLNWAARLSIVKGIARGLAYLHQSLPSHKVPHANLKSSNVIILHNNQHPDYHPKLTDFGYQPLLPSPDYTKTLAAGKSPESSQGKKLTSKADIFCFGLILLEVITGEIPRDSEDSLAEWVRSAVNNEWSTDLLDLELVAEEESHEEMLKLTEISLECTSLEPHRRPKMSEVLRRIEEIKVTRDDERA